MKDTFDVVDELSLGQYGGGQYIEIKDLPSWVDRGKTTYQFRYFYERQRFLGKPDEEIGRYTPIVAGMNHVTWGTSPNGVTLPCNSYANLHIQHGQWAVNGVIDWGYSRITGNGAGNVYPFAA